MHFGRKWKNWGDAASDQRADVGRIIFEQFGGRRAMAMIGGQAMLLNTPDYGEGGLGIKWPNKQRSKGNYVEIILRPDDTYDMTFYNLTIRAKKPVKTYKGVYAEDLRRLFEDQTGWRLSLGPMHGLGDSRRNQWLVVAFFPWGEGREILASLATRREAREYAAWERRHPGTPRETTIRVMHEDEWKQMVEEEEYDAGH